MYIHVLALSPCVKAAFHAKVASWSPVHPRPKTHVRHIDREHLRIEAFFSQCGQSAILAARRVGKGSEGITIPEYPAAILGWTIPLSRGANRIPASSGRRPLSFDPHIMAPVVAEIVGVAKLNHVRRQDGAGRATTRRRMATTDRTPMPKAATMRSSGMSGRSTRSRARTA